MGPQIVSHHISSATGFWDGLETSALPDSIRADLPLRYLQAARRELQKHFLVDDISLRDGIELREALRDAVRMFIANQRSIDAGESKPTRQINIYREAVIIWLGRVYEPKIYEHPVVDIYLGGQYWGSNVQVWRDFVDGLRGALSGDRE